MQSQQQLQDLQGRSREQERACGQRKTAEWSGALILRTGTRAHDRGQWPDRVKRKADEDAQTGERQ